jgi:hypothetical protein
MSGITYLLPVLFPIGFDYQLFLQFSHSPLPMTLTVNGADRTKIAAELSGNDPGSSSQAHY